MKTPLKDFPSRRSGRGFTLIELLTVIAIIGILAAILIPVVGRVRESARRANCVANVREIGMAAIMIAQEYNNDRFPDPGLNHPNHLRSHDMTPGSGVSYADIMVDEYEMPRDVFYCPSNPGFNLDKNWWGSSRATGYVIIAGNPRIADPEDERRDYPTSVHGEFLRQEIVADITSGPNFEGRSGHVTDGAPAGGNVMVLDGAVEWRPFAEMGPQYTAGGFIYHW